MECDVLVIGGGAAGIFGALNAAENSPGKVVVLEAGGRALSKVKISGGGRCNVTHACFDLSALVQNYPRGGKALSSIFSRFMPQNTMQWFEDRGVPLKVEKDGRVFPQSDSSQSIIDCLLAEARRLGVQILTSHKVRDLKAVLPLLGGGHEGVGNRGFEVDTSQGVWRAPRLLLAPGGSPAALEWLKKLGHHPVNPVPSLFTFTVPDPRLQDLAGVSVSDVRAWLEGDSLSQRGALLITHWGMSGPVILRLSAWGARALAERNYRQRFWVDWLPALSQEQIRQTLQLRKQEHPKRLLASDNPWPQLPRRLWSALMGEDRPWGHLQDRILNRRAEELKRCPWDITAKGVFKEEFVMAGGVPLNEVDLKTMQSRHCPGLYLAGEVLDVDGITGGFNFQNAWATGFIAGQALSRS